MRIKEGRKEERRRRRKKKRKEIDCIVVI